MRFLSSFLFLVSALSVGALAYFPHVAGPHPDAIDIAEIEATPPLPPAIGGAISSQDAAGRSFSPTSTGFRKVADAGSAGSSQPGSAANDPSQAVVSGGAWQTNVTVVKGDGDAKRRSSVTPSGWNERVELARSLQVELKRVGCYSGAADGDWGGASKRAMTSFLQKVNATLPVEVPDYILLTLLQGHTDKACGIECPSGQNFAADGRCISNAIVAQGPGRNSLLARKTTGEVGGQRTTLAAAVNTRPADKASTGAVAATGAASVAPAGTTAAAAPAGRPAAQAKAAQVKSGAPARSVARSASPPPVAQPAPNQYAAIQKAQPQRAAAPPAIVTASAQIEAAAPAAAAPPPVEPLPGRMAIGAPIPEAPGSAPASLATAPQAVAPAIDIAPRPAKPRGSTIAALTSPDNGDAVQVQAPAAAPPAVAIAPTKARRANARPRGSGQFYSRSTPAKAYRSYEPRNGYAVVRTSQGKVRRGSPTHNLMLSLGGVF